MKVRIVLATNAAIDGLNGQSNLTTGAEVTLASVQTTTFSVRRLVPGAFTVQIEVTDGCGVWRTLVGGGTGVS